MGQMMDNVQFQLILNRISDVKEGVDACHAEIRATNQVLASHIKDDQLLAREVWFMSKAVKTTWGAAVAIIGIVLAWMGIGQK